MVDIENPKAWDPAKAVEAGIGPGNPMHPYFRVYHNQDGTPLPLEALAQAKQQAEVLFPDFPLLKTTVERPEVTAA